MLTELMSRLTSNCTENGCELSQAQKEAIEDVLVFFANRFEVLENSVEGNAKKLQSITDVIQDGNSPWLGGLRADNLTEATYLKIAKIVECA